MFENFLCLLGFHRWVNVPKSMNVFYCERCGRLKFYSRRKEKDNE